MAQFFNQATLSYNAGSATSNVTVGELLETLSASKTALPAVYGAGDTVTYAVSIANAGTAPFTGLTVTDDLGAFTEGAQTLVPLDYLAGSARLYVNGVLQTAPAVTTDPLTFTGINVPAGGNALLLYQAAVNAFAPLAAGSTITNTAVVSGGGLAAPLTATAEITAESAPALSISKSICPSTVTENEPITYTFVIQNSGSAPAASTDNLTRLLHLRRGDRSVRYHPRSDHRACGGLHPRSRDRRGHGRARCHRPHRHRHRLNLFVMQKPAPAGFSC